jgi:hypothetical protein
VINKYEKDLQVVDHYCETCLDFINPVTVREICARGLFHIINSLPKNVAEAKAVARARMAVKGKYFNDPEIDDMAGKIQHLEMLKKRLVEMNMADPHHYQPVLQEMLELSHAVLNYYKPVHIP